jgi:outer membrane protein assembly factor BamB
MKIRISEKGLSILKTVSLISGSFTIIVALTMIFSLVQLNIIKPLDSPVLLNLKEQYDRDTGNEELKEQIRALDLVARKAYFSSRWQVETGTYLLLIGAAVFVLCQQLISGNKKELPAKPGEKSDIFLVSRKNRKYVLYSAGIIFTCAVAASFILRTTLPDPSRVMTGEMGMNTGNVEEDNDQIPVTTFPDTVSNQSQEITPSQPQAMVQNVPSVKNETVSVVPVSATNESKAYLTSFPSFRGKGGRGIADGTGYPLEWNGKEGKNIKWKWKVPKPGFNSPVIWGEKLFLSGADKQGAEIYCIDKNTGKLFWTTVVSDIPGSPGVLPETTDDTGLSAPSLTTNGKFVCAMYANGNLVTLDMDGKIIWSKAFGIPKNHYGHSSSLIVYSDILLVQYDRNDKSALYGFDIATGNPRWETPRAVKISWASPVIAIFNGIPQVILNADPFVAAYDPLTGKELWKIKTMSAEIGPSVAVNESMVFAANEFAKLVAIKVGKEPVIVWEDNQFLPEVSSPVATNELLFVATTYGAVACYNASKGELLWDHEFEYGFYSSPMLNGNLVYLLDISGVMHIFSAEKEFKLAAESPVGEKTVCTPAFSQGKIYIRGNENLYCISAN